MPLWWRQTPARKRRRISDVSHGTDNDFFLYVLALLGSLFLIWVIFEWRAKRRRYEPPGQKLWRCNICGYFYVADGEEKITKCPRCDSFQDDSDKEREAEH